MELNRFKVTWRAKYRFTNYHSYTFIQAADFEAARTLAKQIIHHRLDIPTHLIHISSIVSSQPIFNKTSDEKQALKTIVYDASDMSCEGVDESGVSVSDNITFPMIFKLLTRYVGLPLLLSIVIFVLTYSTHVNKEYITIPPDMISAMDSTMYTTGYETAQVIEYWKKEALREASLSGLLVIIAIFIFDCFKYHSRTKRRLKLNRTSDFL